MQPFYFCNFFEKVDYPSMHPPLQPARCAFSLPLGCYSVRPSAIYTVCPILESVVYHRHRTQFHQWGIKKQVPKDEYFCVHLGKDSTTLCRLFVLSTLCVLSVLCYINIKKRPVEQLEGVFFIVRHSLHYQIRPGILRFSVHILIALLVLVYLCTKIPL